VSDHEPRALRSSAWRFLVAGGANTAVTAIALTLLASVIAPWLAYTIVFALGIVIAVALAGGFVFGVKMTRRLALAYSAMYVVVYLVGLAALAVARALGLPDAWSGAVVLVTAPLTFIGGRILLVLRNPDHRTTERKAA
jgi:putative flippase GtrA